SFRAATVTFGIFVGLFVLPENESHASFFRDVDEAVEEPAEDSCWSSVGFPRDDAEESEEDDSEESDLPDAYWLSLDAALLSVPGNVSGGMSAPSQVGHQPGPFGSMVADSLLANLDWCSWLWIEGNPRVPAALEMRILDPPRIMDAV